MPFATAIMAATEKVAKEQEKRPLTPFDDPSNNDDSDNNKPRYKDTFGSFGMRSSRTARDKPPHRPCGTGDNPFSLENLPQDDKEEKAH